MGVSLPFTTSPLLPNPKACSIYLSCLGFPYRSFTPSSLALITLAGLWERAELVGKVGPWVVHIPSCMPAHQTGTGPRRQKARLDHHSGALLPSNHPGLSLICLLAKTPSTNIFDLVD